MSARDREEAIRREYRKLRECLICGRRGGQLAEREAICTRCRNGTDTEIGLAPTRLHRWRTAVGMSVIDLADAADVGRGVLMRALRGDAVAPRIALKLARVTKIPADFFIVGDPPPASLMVGGGTWEDAERRELSAQIAEMFG